MTYNLNHLNYIVAVADTGSVQKAAENCFITPPAISSAIKHIEDLIGYKIFVRVHARGLVPSSVGNDFILKARQLLKHSQKFEDDVMGLGDAVSGKVYIACYSITMPFLFPPIYHDVVNAYPRVYLSPYFGNQAQIIDHLLNGESDIAICYDMVTDSSITFETIAELYPQVLLSANDPLSGQKSVSLLQLVKRDLIYLDLPVQGDFYLNLFYKQNLNPRILYRTDSFELIRCLVGLGAGYSFVFMPVTATPTYQHQQVISLPLEEQVPATNVCIAYSKDSITSRRVRAVVDICRKTIRRTVKETWCSSQVTTN